MVRILLLTCLALHSLLTAGCSGAGDPAPALAITEGSVSKPAPAVSEVCADHEAGCPCDEPGQTTDCGRIRRVEGNYVWCATGKQTCTEDGQWSECMGDRDVTGNAPAAR